MLKAFIIGCGKIAGINGENSNFTSHASGYKNNSKVRLISCFDVDKDKAKVFARIHDCGIADSIEDCLKKYCPEIISICTPDITHFDIVKNILLSTQDYMLALSSIDLL